jgi:outer membrane protein insertion porin family
MRTKLFALLFLLFSLSGIFAQTNTDWYQTKPIRSITFEGLKNVTRSELDGLFSSYLGKKFTDDLYMEVLQKLYALDYFTEITPVALPADADRTSVILKFTVIEKPVIKKIQFIGNNRIRTSDLLSKVTLKDGDIYNEQKSRLDERAIRDYYLEKGYSGVKVASEAITGSDKSITLQFSVTEGKPTVISSIQFEGNTAIASKTLLKIISLKEEKLFNPGTFQESKLEADKATIKRYYNERGYVDASVESVQRDVDTVTSKDKNLLKLTFVIKEGDQYVYGGTTITGNQIFSTAELLGKIKLKQGDVLNLNRFNEGYQAVADVYFENGYTSNYINRQEKRDTDHKTISFVITIVESDRSHIEHILIKGNKKTKDRVILREISLEPGDIFSKSKLMDSVRNLYNLRYFSTVAPDLVQGSEKNLVDVVLALEEQSTASVQFGVTFSGVTDANSFPLSVFVQWEDKNFLGNGQTVSTNVTVSPDTQSLALGYSENWFLGSPLTVSFNLSGSHKQLYAYQDVLFPLFTDSDFGTYGIIPDPYTSYSAYSATSSIDTSYRMIYDRWEYALGTSTGYRWSPGFASVTLRGGLNFSIVQNIYDDKIYRPADQGIRDQHGKWVWINSVWTRLSLDTRNNNYDPSTGWFTSQQFTLYGLVPQVESDYYIRSDTKAEVYFTLLDFPVTNSWNLKIVLAGFTGLSFLSPDTSKPISDTNKLYIDGMFIGRGWTALYSTVRGNLMINHSVELRVPVAAGIMATDFYFDAVAVKSELNQISSLSLNDYYFSYGPSLRFTIPQFPLKLMLANTFRIQDGKFQWGNGVGPDWKFVLSFTIANL